ncbi:MAG: GAF and ANTAR domain-containing protein [Terrimesophilobacter sp.]
MSIQSRETRLNAAFVAVADTLTADYDVVDLLHTLVSECAEILNVQAGGLMLADADGNLQLVASTSESADLVEVMQLAAGAGPCVDCFTTGTAVSVPDIAATGQKWPAFRQAALSQRFLSVHATPMRLRGTVIGTMNLFGTATGEVNRADAAVAQALADVATIGIIQERVAAHSQLVAEQLQRALDSRILIEQAKGALAQATTMTTDEAFNSLRRYARSHNLTLHAVAEGVTGRTIAIDAISEASSSTRISR